MVTKAASAISLVVSDISCKAVEACLFGMEPGDNRVIRVEPEDAYGPHIEALVQEIPLANFQGKFEPQPGMILSLTVDQDGEFSVGIQNSVSIIYALGTLLAVPLIAYGILRTQLFDIDLKIRWTIKQSTVAGIFIAVMFVISEGASQFLSDELGKVTGLLAAGVLMFFLAPLQQFAERVATKAMPNTNNTPEYASFRKMQVYEAAFTEAQMEGGISQKERALLAHLRDSLGISQADAEAIEGNLQA